VLKTIFPRIKKIQYYIHSQFYGTIMLTPIMLAVNIFLFPHFAFGQNPTQIRITPSLTTGKISLEAHPLVKTLNESEFRAALTKSKESGATIYYMLAGDWPDIEPTAGTYNWHALDLNLNVLEEDKFKDMEVALDIGGLIALSYDSLKLPSHIQFKRFNDPSFKAAYREYFGALFDYLFARGSNVDYILIHAEGAHEYFTYHHPEQLNDYCDLVADAMRYIKQRSPTTKVGINEEYYDSPSIVNCINRESDFISFIIDPPSEAEGGLFDNPAYVETIIRNLLLTYPNKKIAVEAGYPTSIQLGYNEQKQATFIASLFKVLKANRDRIEYIDYYGLFDEDKTTMHTALRGQVSPQVYVVGNATQEAIAIAQVNADGVITAINIIFSGSGYTQTPQITIIGGGGNGASAKAIISGGKVTKIIVTNGGGNYFPDYFVSNLAEYVSTFGLLSEYPGVTQKLGWKEWNKQIQLYYQSLSSLPTATPVRKPGDTNGDNLVNIHDYNNLVIQFNQTGTNLSADFNNSGKVDVQDYNILVTNFRL